MLLLTMAGFTLNGLGVLAPQLKDNDEFFLWSKGVGVKAWKNVDTGNPMAELPSGPADLVFAPFVGPDGEREMKWHIRVRNNKFWVIGLVPKQKMDVNHERNVVVSESVLDLPAIWTTQKENYMPQQAKGLNRNKNIHDMPLEIWASFDERKVVFWSEDEQLVEFSLNDSKWDDGFYFVLNGYYGTLVELQVDRMYSHCIKG
uniref:Galectin n=1 Tax=Paramoeba aestuarina TaxID=180227 RepID=A0A7S4KTK5_9EUKA